MTSADAFFAIVPPHSRPGYLRASRLREALANPKILQALVRDLRLELRDPVSKCRPEQLFEAILQKAIADSSHRGGSFEGAEPAEILAAYLYRCRGVSDRAIREIFYDVARESKLLEPVVEWLIGTVQCREVFAEVPLGKKRADLAGWRLRRDRRGDTPEFIAIELKCDEKEFSRAVDQLTTYREHSSAVYVAFPPMMGAAYLATHATSRGAYGWDEEVLNKKMKAIGCGILLVEGSDVSEFAKPAARTLTPGEIERAMQLLKRGKLVRTAG